VHIATKRGQAGVLLQRLIALVEDDRVSLGAHPSGKNVRGVEAKAQAREAPDANPTFPTGALILEFCRQKLNLFKGR
jgi:hypothetical protein